VKGLRLTEIVSIADRLFPLNLAEPWDNCGIQIGDPDRRIFSAAFSLDPTLRTVSFAAEKECQLLITHHPVLLEPIKNFLATNHSSSILMAAARARVDIVSLHTNLDAAPGGLNDCLAKAIGMQDISVPMSASCARFGRLSAPMSVYELASVLVGKFESSSLRVIADKDILVETVFCASGSGMGYWSEVLRCNPDVVVTGDVRYHSAQEAIERGIPVIDAGHFHLEKTAPVIMAAAFKREFDLLESQISCLICELEKDPFVNIYHLEEDYPFERTARTFGKASGN
jgi:GTP cyclohydrolase I